MSRPKGEQIKSQKVPDFKGLPDGLVPKKTAKIKIYEFIKNSKKPVRMGLLYKKFTTNEGTIRRYVREMEAAGFIISKECECGNSKVMSAVERS